MATLNYTVTEVDQGINEQINGEMAQDTGYDDLKGSISSSRKLDGGSLSTISHDYGTGIDFAGSRMDEGDTIYLTLQSSHGMKLMTALENHIHFTITKATTTSSHLLKFQLYVAVAGVFGDWELLTLPNGGLFTVDLNDANSHGDVCGINQHWLASFGDSPAGNTSVSSMYKVRLERVSITDGYNDSGQDLLIDYFDSHYQIDQERGSKDPYSKEGY